MLGVLLGELGELGINGGDAVLVVVREIGAGLLEILKGFLDMAVLDFREGLHFRAAGDGFDDVPQARVKREGGEKVGDFGEKHVEGLALGGVVGNRIEVLQAAPGLGEGFGCLFEGDEAALVGGGLSILSGNPLHGLLRLFQGVADGGLDGVRCEGGPADLEIWSEEVHREICLDMRRVAALASWG